MDVIVLALAKKYTEDTVIGLGAVKGKPCTIANIEKTTNGNIVSFKWTGDDGTVKTQTLEVKDGKNGVSVKSAVLTDENHLILTLSDDTVLDAGEITVDSKSELTEDLTATVAIGSVSAGKKYSKGTNLETIIRDILIKEVAPGVTLALDPNKTLYDIVTETITSIKLIATVTKGTYDPKSLKFYADSTEIKAQTITAAGNYAFVYNPETPIKVKTTFKAVVGDGKLTGQATKDVKFVAHSYYGTVSDSVSAPTEAEIKVLENKSLKDTKELTYAGINMDYGKVVYAYPQSFGLLTAIKDPVNNYNYFDSFARTATKVDGIDYYVYTQIDPSASENVKLTFA